MTFGDKPSPDMVSFVMLKIAEECKVKTPEASKIIERDRYAMTSSIRVHRYKMHSRESPTSKAALTAAASRLKNGIALHSSFEHWLTRVKV